MVTSYSRGHVIYFDGVNWRYADDKSIYDDNRPCIRCGKMPTEEGHDACLGNIRDAKSACCGHGVETKYLLR